MPKKNELHFEVSANLQKLIGEELISNEEMAFIELVKNAYDSGARSVTITIVQQTLSTAPYITIADDGDGMTLENFVKRFMFAGYSEREDEAVSATRVPTGEKGIGRFAADKIGAGLVVTTKTADSAHALQVNFDWNAFRQKTKLFNEIVAPYSYVEPPSELNSKGTLLTISQLRSRWDGTRIEELQDALRSLLNPYSAERGFEIRLNVVGQRPSSETLKPQKPVGFDYELLFRVTAQGQVQRRFRGPGVAMPKEWKTVPGIIATRLGELKGRLLYYVRKPAKTLVSGLPPGVQLYRDGFLMQPFGSPISDRLKLIEKRAKRAGHAPLVPNRLFGFVEITRLAHPSLKDTTSRQAMIETGELHELVAVLKDQTTFLEENLLEEVAKPSWRRSKQEQSIVLEQARLNSLGNLSVGIGHEIRQPLQSILSHADAIQIRLDDLNIHDEEIADSIQKINDAAERIDGTITFIKQLSSGDLENITSFDLAATVRKEVKLLEGQSDINFVLDLPAHQTANTNQTTIIHVLVNLLRNSVEAIRDVQDDRAGKIRVALKRDGNRHVIEVEDNGIGIPEDDKPKIFKMFNTKKTGGLGFGLTYCYTILEAQGGKISFTSKKNVGTTFRVEVPERANSDALKNTAS